jgi:hypothetical protein
LICVVAMAWGGSTIARKKFSSPGAPGNSVRPEAMA